MISEVVFVFDLPFVLHWTSPPLSLNYILLISFVLGLTFAASAGAFRMTNLKSQAKEIRNLKKELTETRAKLYSLEGSRNNTELPSLVGK